MSQVNVENGFLWFEYASDSSQGCVALGHIVELREATGGSAMIYLSNGRIVIADCGPAAIRKAVEDFYSKPKKTPANSREMAS